MRFTKDSTKIVLHLDLARVLPWNFSQSSTKPYGTSAARDGEWAWLQDDGPSRRVLINRMRIRTYRRTGSLLAAHFHNFAYATTELASERDAPTHFLFLAHNCFFVRLGIERFVAVRSASAAIRDCPEVQLKSSRHHCTTMPWFAPVNAHKNTARRLLLEGQFYPVHLLERWMRELDARDVRGRMSEQRTSATANRSARAGSSFGFTHRRGGGRMLGRLLGPTESNASRSSQHHAIHRVDQPISEHQHPDVVPTTRTEASVHFGGIGRAHPSSLLELLPSVGCTAEESLIPALVLRTHHKLFAGNPPTEPVAWIPNSLANGSAIDGSTVRWLFRSIHTPQILCHKTGGGNGVASTCSTCPDPAAWPQTKFLVKRVADDPEDRTVVCAS